MSRVFTALRRLESELTREHANYLRDAENYRKVHEAGLEVPPGGVPWLSLVRSSIAKAQAVGADIALVNKIIEQNFGEAGD